MITLSQRAQDYDHQATVSAGVYHKMTNVIFLIEVSVFHKVLAILQAISKILQTKVINWHQVCAEIQQIFNLFSTLSTNKHFYKEW